MPVGWEVAMLGQPYDKLCHVRFGFRHACAGGGACGAPCSACPFQVKCTMPIQWAQVVPLRAQGENLSVATPG